MQVIFEIFKAFFATKNCGKKLAAAVYLLTAFQSTGLTILSDLSMSISPEQTLRLRSASTESSSLMTR